MMQSGLWETVALAAMTQVLGQCPTIQLSFEPTLVRRGDGSTTTRTMVPTMMPNCKANLIITTWAASQNSTGQGPRGGAKASHIQIPRVLPCPSMTMQRTTQEAVCVQGNSSSVAGTAVRQCNHCQGKRSSVTR
jgi:hypothetical protein